MGKVTDRITDVFKEELDLGDNDTDVLRYSLAVYSTTVIGYAAIILAAWPFGVVGLALISVVTASLFRIFSGGAHASVSRNCILGGAVIFTLLGILAKHLDASFSVLLLTTISAAIFAGMSVYKYAPADTPGKPITTKQQKSKLRRYSFIYLACWFMVAVLSFAGIFNIKGEYLFASALGILWQGFSLTPSGYCVVGVIDKLWKKISEVI